MQITAAVLRNKAQPFALETLELDAPRADAEQGRAIKPVLQM